MILGGASEGDHDRAPHAGFREAAEAQPGIRIAAFAHRLLSARPRARGDGRVAAASGRIDGVLAANDVMALGALDAMRERDARSRWSASTPRRKACKAIKSGDMLATAAFDAMKMACLSWRPPSAACLAKSVPSEIILPVEIIDRSNCAAWDRPYSAERPLPEWGAYVKA